MKRIPALDGLRAVSILFVLLGHFSEIHPRLGTLDSLAKVGVRTFFVISGYLITTLLLREMDVTGTIRLRGFFRRRIFRIAPAFYLYLSVIAILGLVGAVQVTGRDLWRSALYTVDYNLFYSNIVGHIWSLSVEEQFYLLWPVTLLWFGSRKGFRIATAVVILLPFVRIVQFNFTSDVAGIGWEFHTVADSIAIGCVLAYTDKWVKPWVALACVTTIALSGWMHLTYAFGQSALNIFIACCVCWAIRYRPRILDWRPLVWIGTVSYSIYLWQQLFVYSTPFPLNLVLIFGVAALSYYVIEKPMIALGHRGKQVSLSPDASVVPKAL